jgi:hypothetical protein
VESGGGILLLVRSERHDRIEGEHVRAVHRARGGASAGEFLAHRRPGYEVHPQPAVLLRNREAHQVELPKLRHVLAGPAPGLVRLLGFGAQLFITELANGIDDGLLILGEVREGEVHEGDRLLTQQR